MPLNLPIYILGRTYVLHSRINGRQFKRSLKTADPRLAKLRAIQLLGAAYMSVFPRFSKPSSSTPDQEWRRFEMDVKNGVFKTDDTPEDHERMMRTFEAWKAWKEVEAIGPIPGGWSPAAKTADRADAADAADVADKDDDEDDFVDESLICSAKGPKFSVIFAHFKGTMTHRDPATFTDYETNVKEFEAFIGGLPISQICPQHITDFIGHLTKKGNTPTTIDKKIGSLRALFNYGKKQKLKVSGENFASERNLVSKSEKEAGGHKFYELDEVKEVLGCEAFMKLAEDSRNFYLIMLAELVTGVRISALAALTAADCRTSIDDHPYFRIADDKTPSGERSVPIPAVLHAPIKAYLTEHESFGFVERKDGKGASDPVRKILQVHLDAIGAAGRNFTIHGLRKTLNAYFFQKGVPFEARCQIMGHKISHVNVGVYLPGSTSQKFSLDDLAAMVNPHQLQLLKIVGFI